MTDKRRPYSSVIVDGLTQTPSRAMLRAVGFDDDDFKTTNRNRQYVEHGHSLQHAYKSELAITLEKVRTRLAPRLLYLIPSPSVTVLGYGYARNALLISEPQVICDSIETVVAGQAF